MPLWNYEYKNSTRSACAWNEKERKKPERSLMDSTTQRSRLVKN
jgi:hypothetical protein